jgi:amino acid adenylation domain-containing protein
MTFATFAHLVQHRTQHQPTQIAYTFLGDGDTHELTLTYSDLDRRARSIGAALQELAQPGDRALLLFAPGIEYVTAFFGCLYAGVIAVPAYPPNPARLDRTLPRLNAIAQNAQPSVVMTTAQIAAIGAALAAEAPEFQAMRWLATDTIGDDAANGWREPALTSDTLAFLQYTSGSTAAPKGVMLTHGNLLHNSALIYQAFDHSPNSQGVIWLPPYHDMGLIGGVLQPLYGGFPVALMSPVAFLQRPLRWLEAISRFKATTSGGPNFAYDLCVRKVTLEHLATLDLSHWTVAFNGAEPVRHETLERFAETFAPCGFRREAFYPCYGLAEATLIVTGGLHTEPPITRSFDGAALEGHRALAANSSQTNARSLVSSGGALAGQSVIVADPETHARRQPGQVGEIWVAGPSVAQGYWQQPDATERNFRARLADSGEGPFLRTGDLGFIDQGELFVTGRLKDLIIIRGRNYYPQDIELTVERSHPALRPGCGAAFAIDIAGEERLAVVQEVDRQHRDLDVDALSGVIRQAVAEQHEARVYAVALLKHGSIPKTSSGKIQRHACKAGYLDGSLSVLGASVAAEQPSAAEALDLTRESLLAADPALQHPLLTRYLQTLVVEAVGQLPTHFTVDHPISTLGMDSLQAVELQHHLEQRLGVVMPMTRVLDGVSIAQLTTEALETLRDDGGEPQTDAQPDLPYTGALSHGQQALWFLHRLAPDSGAYNIAGAARIASRLDVAAFERALQALVARHPALRTTFAVNEGQPTQRVHERMDVALQTEQIDGWSDADLESRLADAAYQPFNLERGPLLRVKLFSRSVDEHIVLLALHHIIADFWSLATLAPELAAFYSAELRGTTSVLEPLAYQYTDYVRRQRALLSGPEGRQLWNYWRDHLAGSLPTLDLPTDRPRPAAQTFRGASETALVGSALTQRLKAFSKSHGVTLTTSLLTAFQVLLARYSGQSDILIGVTTAGRTHAQTAKTVGYFVNPVVVRADVAASRSGARLLAETRQRLLAAQMRQEYPFSLLVERLQPERDPSRSPIFQALFSMQQLPAEASDLSAFALGAAGARFALGDLTLESVVLPQRTAQFDLTLALAETADGLGAALQYNSDLFDSATARRMLDHFQTLLEALVAGADRPIADLPLLRAGERTQMLAAWNATASDYPREQCLHQLIETQAQQRPNAIAAEHEGQTLTYRDLDHRANQLAHYLRQHGVETETRVGLCVERSFDMLVGLLGILKAGGAYVPLDPAYPRERLALMLDDSGAPLLLTQQHLTAQLPPTAAQMICLDSEWADIALMPTTPLASAALPQNLAYVIYTSGSTGKPKGVQIPHVAVVNFLESMRKQPGLSADDVLLSVTTLSFDIAALEVFLPLTTGARVVLIPREVAADGVRLAQRLEQTGATVMQATPATWRLLIETGWRGKERLRVLCGGEGLPRDLAAHLTERSADVWNMYGPTETTIWSATSRITPDAAVITIGRPIANSQMYVLDSQLQPVPIGVSGELYIGGDGLARGYINRPDLTAEKFIPDPFNATPGARMYHTGDVARYRPDGTIECLGRIDHQVKVRGYRIELGEIEARLAQHPAVRAGVVLAQPLPHNANERRLTAYVVLETYLLNDPG